MVNLEKLKEGFTKFSEFVGENQILKKTIVEGLKYVPTIGPILSELFDANIGNESDKCNEIIQIVKNLEKFNDNILRNTVENIETQKEYLIKNNNSLNQLLVLSNSIIEGLEEIKLKTDINTVQIQIDIKSLHWELVDSKSEIIKKIDKTSSELKQLILETRYKEIQNKNQPNLLLSSDGYQKKEFEVQLPLFKKQVIVDYEHFDEYKKIKPIISNFKKFDGYTQYVVQNFKDLRTNEEGENIVKHIENKIEMFNDVMTNQKKIRSEIETLEDNIEKSKLKKVVINLLKTIRPTTIKEVERLNEKVEHESLKSIKLDLKFLKIVKNEKILLEKIGRKNSVIKNMKINENKLNRIKKILEKPKNIKKQLEELYQVDFRVASDSLIRKTKKKIEELEKEQGNLDKQILSYLEKQKDAEGGYTIYKEQFDTILESEKKVNNIRTKNSKLDNAIQEKMQKTSSILDEIKIIELTVTRIDNLKKSLKEISRDMLIPVTGDYGSGKSAVSHNIFVKLCKIKNNIPIFIPLGLLEKHDDLKNHLLEDIFKYVVKEYRFNITKTYFYELVKSSKIIFVLDALDEMSTKLDNKIAQEHLNHAIKLSKICTVILTSRETYFSEGMRLDLIEYEGLIKISDFNKKQISKFLRLKLGEDETRIKEIEGVIQQERFFEFAQKPLFLDVIQRNFDTLKNYLVINESVILEVLTDEWIKHDILIEEEADPIKKEKMILARQKISEILAFEEYNQDGKPIQKKMIEKKVKVELEFFDPEAEERLDEFYAQAITSTFLIYEENETYRFIIKPIMEYFIAKRIVNELNNSQEISLLKHISQINHIEIFDFIRGLIDKDWGIKPHIINQLQKPKSEEGEGFDQEKIKEATNFLKTKENLSANIIKIVKKYGKKSSKYNVSNLVKILHITGNLPPRPNFSNLDLKSVDLRGANLTKADLSNTDLTGADLSGATLIEANMKNANLTNTLMIKSNLNKADLSGAIMINSDLSYSDLCDIIFNNKTKFQKSIFIRSKIDKLSFRDLDLRETTFIGVNFKNVSLINTILTNATIKDCNLKNVSLTGAKLIDSDLRNSDFSSADIRNTKFNRAKMNYCILVNCIVDKHTIFNNAKLIYADLNNTNIKNTEHYGTDFTYAINR